MEDGNPQKLEYRLSFNAEIYLEQCNNLRSRIATILERKDLGRLVLLFASDGGNTDQALSLYNWLRSLPVEIQIHATGHVGSSAFPVFLAGSYRTCSALSRFFIHEYDWGFTARQTLKRMAEAQQRLRSDIDMARQIIKDRTSVPDEISKALDGEAFPAVVTPDIALKYGIVSKIGDLGQTGKDGIPVAIWI
jgi:ATP-dependent protease ClpP protease subunit